MENFRQLLVATSAVEIRDFVDPGAQVIDLVGFCKAMEKC